MAGRIRSFDWASTPLGPIGRWPHSLRSIIDLMLDAPWLAVVGWGADFCVVYNDAFAATLKDGAESALGRPFREVWMDPARDEILAGIRAGKARRVVDRCVETPHRAEQLQGWFTSSWTPLRDEIGTVVGFHVAAIETSDRVLAERALQERKSQQAFFLRLSDALRPLADPAAIQDEACRLLGEHLGTDHAFYVAIHESEGVAVVEQDHARGVPSFTGTHSLDTLDWVVPLYRQGRSIVVAETRSSDLIPESTKPHFMKDGIAAWIGIPLVKHGELVGILSVVHGSPHAWSETEVALVTETSERIWAAIERARAEQQARDAEARLRTMADAAPVLIWDRDSAGNVFVNEHYLTFFGTTFDDLMAKGWVRFIHPDDAEAYTAAYEEADARRRPFFYEVRVFRADGQCRWLIVSGRPHGKDRFVGISIDITERREAEERLTRNNAILRGINRIFSATLSAASVEDLARIALGVAADLTESPAGLIATTELGTGRLVTLATIEGSEPNGAAALERTFCHRYDPAMRGLDSAERTPSDAILRIPLAEGAAVAGMIGLAGRPGGYRPEDRVAAEALAPAIRHALLSKGSDLRLRESEARFRQFAQASSDVLWITDAQTFATEFASPALQPIYGLSEAEILGDARLWAAHIVPEDRARTFAEMERVRGGEAVVYEFRILRPSDGSFRWIRNHVFPLLDEDGRVRRIGGITSDVTEMRQAEHHQRVLLAELQHRVRNIMALTRSIVMRSGERAESVEDYAALVGGRLLTLARVQSRLTRAADAGVAISAILHDEIGAQAERDDQYDLAGPEIELAPKAAEVLTLAIHELTTNARKHGALSNGRGRVSARWRRVDRNGGPWLSFLWIECGGPAPADGAERRRGFGSELIEGMIPYELSGHGRIELTAEGARCHLEFPLQDGASILETGSPERATMFGGAIDMTVEPDLTGRRILVVEDDYYLATDIARALRGAGAEVLGPCATEDDAQAELDEQRPDAVVIDVNLGLGPSFKLAWRLKDGGIPFVFTTGYDAGVISPEFEAIERLEKPLQLRHIVGAVLRLTAAT
ncbi:PAS domain S-box protein [Methylorubrum sp. SL192]|uniref:PAS domain S-box protein n=1 Tax=Methylorubrum sp. SL192 TaxID=2995167 RepID=UPI0022732BCF|nr:PAS domain S-box protein [Methylorubrum sp. SL192]MCY1644792.1 PAS domain S-box protein [Methylorubrum sp. SL192]